MKTSLLPEVIIIRPILILSIVIGHSFAIYSGSWSIPEYIDSIDWYKYINPLFINFQLPAFVFISGYLYEAKKYKVFEAGFVLKKFKRLMIPALIFSILYYFLFNFDKSEISLVSSLIGILSGEGHLWFLPMLFWCFVSIWVFRNFNLNSKISFVVLTALSILPFPIPFGIGSMLHYIVYFYLGELVWKNKDAILGKMNYKWISCIIAAYIIFLLIYLDRDLFAITTENTFLMKSMNYLMERVMRYFVNITGIFALYLIVIKIVKGGVKIPDFICDANSLCYGVYIIHQFVLVYMYYECSFVHHLNAYALPWIVLSITVVSSLFLSYLLLKTKVGRFLIG